MLSKHKNTVADAENQPNIRTVSGRWKHYRIKYYSIFAFEGLIIGVCLYFWHKRNKGAFG
jgi:hypothetical protein